ncbi:type II toxin-antitoxin system RelE/ParE family toxin [Chryseobacterium scophthalmum]|uniref:type II toxin-antitoxin system RelE/ParE family toxin n=1 Tax=Chryseobacterium scophthalmum TaxID=59733 RepID=UPI001AEBF520|nr:type II toxin-antitoxin system RelE/ParE family toxin [Chryseobacterium scophthalmum]
MKYKISKEALNDLEKIWLYTSETWSKEQADYYFDLIINEIEYLSGNPKSGKDYNEIRKGYFRSRVKSHFIFYRINIKNEEIEIIRILHQQMDISSILNE